FANLVKAFMDTGARAGTLSERLEQLFGKRNICGIRVNEIRFGAEDAGFSEARVAATLTAKTLGADADMIQDWFRSPEKMIQLIAAAEGSHGNGGGSGSGNGTGTGTGTGNGPGNGAGGGPGNGAGTGNGPGGGPGGSGPGAGAGSGGFRFSGTGTGTGGGATGFAGGMGQLQEAELQSLLRLLSQFGEAQSGHHPQLDSKSWQQRISALPQNAQLTLQQALATVAAQSPTAKVDEAMLLRLAEDLAIRFAIDRYQRGEVKVNAV